MFAEGGFLFDYFIRIAARANSDELLRGMELTAEDGEHVHSGVGLFLQQHHNVVAIDFKAFGFFEGDGVGLMRSLLEHGGKAEEFAVGRLVDDYFLMVFVDSRDADSAGDHDVGMTVGVTDLVDALAWSEFLQFDLAGEDGSFVVIEKSEQGNIFERFGVA